MHGLLAPMPQEAFEDGTPHPRIRSVEQFNTHRIAAPVLVVVPTYNERENITEVLRTLAQLPDGVPDVMVVDDGSPDGTGDEVVNSSHGHPGRVLLMRRGGKFGLGVAYLDAHRWILEHAPEYRYIIQMDADFSHDPRMLTHLVREADAYGVAVGSRYVEGGSAPDWSRSRLLLSAAANTYIRMTLRLFFPSYPVRDNTSGYMAWRRDALMDVLKKPVLGDGYSFLTSLKLVAYHSGYPPKEIPIVLRDRRLGVSKLNRNILFEAFKMPWKLGGMFRMGKKISPPTNPTQS